MRNAPSVVFPVGRCAFYGWLLVALGTLGLLVLSGWWLTSERTPAAIAVGAIGGTLWLLWTCLARHDWRMSPVGLLQWDALATRLDNPMLAGAWIWCTESSGQGRPLLSVGVAVDLQRLVLLRLRYPDSTSRWVWVERSLDPLRWNDLRRALTWAGA